MLIYEVSEEALEATVGMGMLTRSLSPEQKTVRIYRANEHASPPRCRISRTTPHQSSTCLSSKTRCNTPVRFDIGKVVQDLKECCDAILFAFVGGRKRRDRRSAGGRPLHRGHRPSARPGEIHHLAGAAAKFPAQRALLADPRRRSLHVAQAA